MPTAIKQSTFTAATREYINLITNQIKNGFTWNHNQAFERMMCGCKVQHAEIEQVQQELDANEDILNLQAQQKELLTQAKALKDQIDAVAKPYTDKIADLKAKAQEIDRKDHPLADQLYRECQAWIKVWVVEKVVAGTPVHAAQKDVVVQFLEEVAGGWRPAPPKEIFSNT